MTCLRTATCGILASLGVVPTALAADRFVDGDAACPGDGSEAQPWCSLDEALAGPLQPGDTILLRESDAPYPAQSWDGAPDGTEGASITLRPAPGQAPIVAGQLLLDGRSYWTIEGLTVDKHGVAGSGIEIRSSMASSRGVVVRDNLVLGVDDRAITVGLDTDQLSYDIEVSGNHVIGARTVGIELFRSVDALVLDNTVEGVVCSVVPFHQQEGITILADNTGTEIAGNVVRDFVPCAPNDELHVVGIRVRASSAGVIHHNLVEIEAPDQTRFTGGISIHEASSGFSVHHNVVRGINGCGLCDGVDFGLATDDVWAHNTVRDTDVAMHVGEATGSRLFGNALTGREVAGALAAVGEIADAQANAYWIDGGIDDETDQAWMVDELPADVSQWKSACNCDADALVEDPMPLAADGLTPDPAGPLVDAAPESMWVEAFVGGAPDIGALEAPLLVEAFVADDGSTVRASVDAGHAPPLVGAEGCGGLEVRREGTALPLASCSAEHDATSGVSTLVVVVASPLHRDDVAELVHLGTVTDAAAIGGRISARLAPFVVPLDTAELPEPGEDSGDDGTSGGGSDGADGPGTADEGELPSDTADATGASGGQTPATDGCACSQRRGMTPVPWAMLLALLGLSRRRRRDLAR